MGAGITALPAHCFDGCEKLSDINLDNVISYDDESLTGTSLSSVTVNCNATFLAGSFNSNKSLVSITLPDNLISIPKYMLADCTNLVDFKLPTATTEIKDMAFAGCTKLELTVPDTVVTFGRNCFEDVKMVYCTSNSACAKYCEENGVKYKLTDVAPPNANDFEVTLSEDSFVYSGYEEKPENVTVYYKGKELWGASPYVDNPDYSVQYTNNINAGTASVVITGMGEYIGTKVVNYTINPLTLTSKSSRINFADGSMGQYKCTGSEIKPKINVFENDHDTRLTEGKDYTVSYSDNINVGTGTIKVTFMGNYTGSISKTFKITPAHQHTFGSWKITKAPTCTTDGEQKRSCTSKDCGHYTETATIPAKGHSYKITSEANPCTGGKVTYTCSKCGDSYTEDVAAQGHKYVDTVVAPTCTTGGYTLHTCSVCKKSYKDNETQPTGHKYITNTVEATCETDGYTEKKCSNCDYYTKTIIPKKGHTPSSEWTVIKQTTCAEAGEQVRYCTTCNKIIERKSIDKLAHTPADEWIITKQPTCAESGEQVRYCTICGEVAEKQGITKLPHTSSDWIIDKEAAPGIAGSMHTECTVCHERLETATIPALARIDISEADATLSTSIYEYDGGYMKPGVVVKLNDTLLVAGKDYTVSYINNKKVGTATVIVNGIVQYTGSISKTFTINPAKQNIQKLETRYGGFFVDWAQKGSATGYEIQYATNYGFTNAETKKLTANRPDTATIGGLYRGRNYFVRVRSYTIVRGSTYYGEWSPIKNVVTASKNMSSVSISNISTKSFTGKAIAQSAKLKHSGSTLKNGRDYTVSYSSNKNVGTATIKFTGKGSYGGVVTKTFKINPAKQNIQKLKSKSRSFFIDWAQKGSATGYEIQYATNSKFSGAKKVTVTNNKTDKKTISKLSGKKKYYVRVRSYTTVKGKKYYGAWSSTKSVTTKR
ncbi:fibronectin type III domain-containing protein [Ruminococcus sp.]|uniref:fibronectin type III domain-containing protein n=1 Tax=Ruminococcus sp. TaxID=41978 RepID=UPI003AB5D988